MEKPFAESTPQFWTRTAWEGEGECARERCEEEAAAARALPQSARWLSARSRPPSHQLLQSEQLTQRQQQPQQVSAKAAARKGCREAEAIPSEGQSGAQRAFQKPIWKPRCPSAPFFTAERERRSHKAGQYRQ